ncbi:MAG: LamG domain-containing protein [Candidatus Poribacteria bacterium]
MWYATAAVAFLAPMLSVAQDMFWPPPTDGLVFVWETGNASNTIPGPGPVGELCRVIPTGQAKFSRFWAMDLTDGAFHAEPMMSDSVGHLLRVARQFTLAAVITPAHADGTHAAYIVSYGATSSEWAFVLAQRGDALQVGLDASAPAETRLRDVGRLEEGIARHVIVAVADGGLTTYIDGRKVSSHDDIRTDFSAWEEPQLWFGAAPDGSGDWSGRLEGVVLYNRALSRDEVQRHYRASAERRTGRTPLPPLEVDALLTRKRDIPKDTAYPNTLVVFDYRVATVREGEYDGQHALVAHWGNLNGHRQRTTEELRVGQVYRLRIEPFDAHPELAALQIVMNLDDIHLPLFYAICEPAGMR